MATELIKLYATVRSVQARFRLRLDRALTMRKVFDFIDKAVLCKGVQYDYVPWRVARLVKAFYCILKLMGCPSLDFLQFLTFQQIGLSLAQEMHKSARAQYHGS